MKWKTNFSFEKETRFIENFHEKHLEKRRPPQTVFRGYVLGALTSVLVGAHVFNCLQIPLPRASNSTAIVARPDPEKVPPLSMAKTR